jgi:hypothetical protein
LTFVDDGSDLTVEIDSISAARPFGHFVISFMDSTGCDNVGGENLIDGELVTSISTGLRPQAMRRSAPTPRSRSTSRTRSTAPAWSTRPSWCATRPETRSAERSPAIVMPMHCAGPVPSGSSRQPVRISPRLEANRPSNLRVRWRTNARSADRVKSRRCDQHAAG